MTVESTTATTISLSWTSAGSVVDSYKVMWQRDTSGDCLDEDEGSTTLTDVSTSYTITGLEESSNYTITVIATNANEMVTSNNVTGFTQESGKIISVSLLDCVIINRDLYLYSSITILFLLFLFFYQFHLLLPLL